MFDEEYLEQHPEERNNVEAAGKVGFVMEPDINMSNLTIEILNKRLDESKKKLLERIRNELVELLLEQTNAGKSVFNSVEYPKHQGYNENNPYSCITNDEADEIVLEFLSKGIFVTHNMMNQKAVVFSFNLQKAVDQPSKGKGKRDIG